MKRISLISFCLACCLCPITGFSQGSLTPPAPPGPTMKSLDQIEARTPVSSLPFTISAPGSYYLTGNLTASGSEAGITVSADNVTIDLNGFALTGGPSGVASGIDVPAAQENLCVRNGTVTRWNQYGIYASNVTGGLYQNLRLSHNDSGLRAGAISSAIGCVALNHVNGGIALGDQSLVSQCTSASNFRGIITGSNSSVLHSTASANAQSGISVDDGCTIADSTASGNQFGIVTRYGCSIRGCTVRANLGHGIEVNAGNRIVGNTCDFNNPSATSSGGGISVTGVNNLIDSNSMTANGNAGLLVKSSGGNLIIRNTFAGPEYIVATGNTVGPLIEMVGGGTLTTNSPWANIHYN